MKLSTNGIIITTIALVAVIGGLTWVSMQDKLVNHRDDNIRSQSAPQQSKSTSESLPAQVENESKKGHGESNGPHLIASIGQSVIGEQFYAADNYFDLVTQIYPAAQSGDSDAQYFLYRALVDCEDWIETREKSTSGKSFEEKLGPSYSGEAFQNFRLEHHNKCIQFLDVAPETFQRGAYWLVQAVDSGNSSALSRSALDTLFFSDRDDAETSMELLRRALSEPSAEAIWDLATAYNSDTLLESSDEKLAAATRLVACRSGLNCSTRANTAIRIECMSGQWACNSENFLDSLRQYYGAEFPEIERLAGEVHSRIKNKNWSELSLLLDENDS